MRRVLVLALLLALAQPAAAAPGDISLVAASDDAIGDGDSVQPAMTPNAAFIAFASDDDDLSTGDQNGFQNIFIRTMADGTMRLVSGAANGASAFPALDDSGRFVAFESDATNLAGGGVSTDIFVRDMETGAFELASRTGATPGNAASVDPAISADGRFVAFESAATNLGGPAGSVYRFDRDTGALTWVGAGQNPSISGDGRFVAWDGGGTVSRADLAGGGTVAVAPGSDPSISADGNRIAFASDDAGLVAGDDNFATDIFLRDVAAGTTLLLSRGEGDAGALADGPSAGPDISPDGLHVAFESSANNLTLDDTFATDVFVRDVALASTTLASRAPGPAGAGGDGASLRPSLGFAGLGVAFDSDADNFSSADDDGVRNVFWRELGGPPVNIAPPQVSGGEVLSCSPGTWRWPVTSFSFTWLRDGAPVAGGADYRPGAADAGSAFVCEVTAANGAGAATARSAAVGLPAAPSGLLVLGVQVTSPFAALRESFNGTRGRDRLIGSVRANTIRGRGGDDLILGGGGNDRLFGEAGNDTIDGETGNDLVDGGTGNDRLAGGDGRDRVKGGAGADRIDVRDGARDTVDCGKGRDRVTADRKDRLKGCERVKRRR